MIIINTNKPIIWICLVLLSTISSFAQQLNTKDSIVTGISGPSSAAGQMARDAQLKDNILPSYFAFKDRLKSEKYFNYTLDYYSVFQYASDALQDIPSSGRSGVVRAFGAWDLAGRKSGNTGSFIFKFENRHSYGDHPTPQDLGFNVGYVGLTAVPFNDLGWAVTNFFWQQSFLKGRVAFQVGLLDPADYTNVYGLVDPWNDFFNLNFSTGATIPLPDQGIGLAIRFEITEQFYGLVGIEDANGDPTNPGGMFNSFFSVGEYFTQAEVGWMESYDKRFSDNLHATIWHVEEKKEEGSPEGWGLALSFNRTVSKSWQPFARAAYAKDGGSLLQKSFETGLGYRFSSNNSQLSIGLGWGQPNESTFGERLRDQYTFEIYYRFNLIKMITLTPDIQFLVNPALNTDKDFLAVFGIRGRIAI